MTVLNLTCAIGTSPECPRRACVFPFAVKVCPPHHTAVRFGCSHRWQDVGENVIGIDLAFVDGRGVLGIGVKSKGVHERGDGDVECTGGFEMYLLRDLKHSEQIRVEANGVFARSAIDVRDE